jgi:protoporphyrinogen oxidase
MKSTFDLIITGGSLASLVAARELSIKGKKVALINPINHWGGHFSPLQFDGQIFDPGMVLYEFDSFSEHSDSDLVSYDPWKRNDSGRFCKKIKNFVSQHVSTHVIETPKMFFNNMLFDDFLIANNLKSLLLLSPEDINNIKHELGVIINKGEINQFHASLKLNSKLFENTSYYEISVANHGNIFHEKFIEPFCKKILNISSKDIISLYHRVGWLPLFYPETLLSYINGKQTPDLKTNFSYPDGFCSTELSKLLFKKIKDCKNITIFESSKISDLHIKDSSYEVNLEGDINVTAPFLVWGLDSSYLLQILNKKSSNTFFDKSSIGFMFLILPESLLAQSFSILNVLDAEFSIYRISNQTRCSGEVDINVKLSIEFNLNYFSSLYGENLSDEEIRNKLLTELTRMRIINNELSNDIFTSVKQLKNALMKPNKDNYDKFLNEYKLVCEVDPNIQLIGPSCGFFASSLNDQIVQGLKISEISYGH